MSGISRCCTSFVNTIFCCRKREPQETWQNYDQDKWNDAKPVEGKSDDWKDTAWKNTDTSPPEGQPGQPARRRCCTRLCGRPSTTTLAAVAAVISTLAGLGVFKLYEQLQDARAVIDKVKTDFDLPSMDYHPTPPNLALIAQAAAPKEQEMRHINGLVARTQLKPADENLAKLMEERGLISVEDNKNQSLALADQLRALQNWIDELPRTLKELGEKTVALEKAEAERIEGFKRALDSKDETIQCQQVITKTAIDSSGEKTAKEIEIDRLKMETQRLTKQLSDAKKQKDDLQAKVDKQEKEKAKSWF